MSIQREPNTTTHLVTPSYDDVAARSDELLELLELLEDAVTHHDLNNPHIRCLRRLASQGAGTAEDLVWLLTNRSACLVPLMVAEGLLSGYMGRLVSSSLSRVELGAPASSVLEALARVLRYMQVGRE